MNTESITASPILFQARQFRFQFPRPALVMGIINVTPDSFYDGAQFLPADAAVQRGLELAAEGADILDVGGESTRPGAEPVPVEVEIQRVVPVISALAQHVRIPISVDTQKPLVAKAALEAGAAIINDIAAHREDPDMRRLAAAAQAGYVLMHMQGTPQTMQLHPSYNNVVEDVYAFFRRQLARAQTDGLDPKHVLLDVGIGFGKNLEHNLLLLGALSHFTTLQRPLLLGVSRKSFIGKLLGTGVQERLPASLACACLGVSAGVAVVRTHDVRETVQAIRMTEAVRSHMT